MPVKEDVESLQVERDGYN